MKPINDLAKLAKLLGMAKFKQFWKDSTEVESLNKAVGWQEAIRKFIAGIISVTYRSIKLDQLQELMNATGEELDAEMKLNEWTYSKEDKTMVIVNTACFESANKIEPKESANMTLEQYQNLFL